MFWPFSPLLNNVLIETGWTNNDVRSTFSYLSTVTHRLDFFSFHLPRHRRVSSLFFSFKKMIIVVLVHQIFDRFFRNLHTISMMYATNDDYDDGSMEATHISDFSPSLPHRIKRERSFCAICGAKATGINFDVLTVIRDDSFLYLHKTISSPLSSVHHAKRSFDAMGSNHW